MTFPEILAADAAAIQARLTVALGDKADEPVIDAMRYALNGGKRLRGFLVLESARLHGVGDRALSAAAAIEALHAYSLIHDDLPCMDDDDLRRANPPFTRNGTRLRLYWRAMPCRRWPLNCCAIPLWGLPRYG